MALYRRAHRQGPVHGSARTVFRVHGADDGASSLALGNIAQFAHHLRKPRRELRAHRHQGRRHIADAELPLLDSDYRGNNGRVVLFPEQYRAKRQHEAHAATCVDEAEKPGAGDTRGNILRRTAQLQHLRAEEEHQDRKALWHHDLPHDRQL